MNKQSRYLKYFAAVLALGLVCFSGSVFALDHDADGKADLIVFRPESVFTPGSWFVSSTALSGTLLYQWGLPGDYPVQGKYSGGAAADLAVWRPTDGTWYVRNFNIGMTFPTADSYQWGLPEDKPYPCDFTGDGRTDMAVVRNGYGYIGYWFVRNSSGGTVPFDNYTVQQWGLPGDTPIPADYDMDGKCDYTVFREGNWYIILSSSNGTDTAVIPWGGAGDIPVPGQYDSDTILDFAIYRESGFPGPLWYIRRSTLAGLTYRIIQWGLVGDVPVPADYTGDGKTDIAVYRPAWGYWFILTSESDYATSVAYQFGLPGDIAYGDRRASDPQ